jgi:hypothetical protein
MTALTDKVICSWVEKEKKSLLKKEIFHVQITSTQEILLALTY